MRSDNKKRDNGIVIHLVKDGVACSHCGRVPEEDVFLPGMCDAHTHGLKERGFAELQMVLAYPEDTISYVLNTIVEKVLSGEVEQKDGVFISNIFTDGAGVRLDLRKDHHGENVFRVVLPDGKFRMPEDSDEYPYNMQSKSPYIKETIIF